MARFEGEIKVLSKDKKFFLILIDGVNNSPKKKYNEYEEAFKEALKLSKEHNKKTFILQMVTKVEQISNVTQFV